jgi:hypothetical protein
MLAGDADLLQLHDGNHVGNLIFEGRVVGLIYNIGIDFSTTAG